MKLFLPNPHANRLAAFLFRRLSVFVEGWTLEAAEEVCVGGDLESFEVLDVLARLVHKSLVMLDERSVTAARAQLDEVALASAWEAGRKMMLEQAIAYALEETDA
jgi:hypothetical protein